LSGAQQPVWVLLGQRAGDNNQLLRLADELGLPFRAIELRYNALHLVPPSLLGASFASLTAQSRQALHPPWPDLILGIGHRSVPAALAIREKSGGRSRLVRLGNPRVDPRRFDMVITTPQYRVPDAPNVIRLEVGLNTATKVQPTREESEWLAKLPRPHRVVLIGGDTFMWTLRAAKVADAARALKAKPGGSTIAVSSARTRKTVVGAVAEALRGSDHFLVWGGFPRYSLLLADADEIYVTADSVAMVSDAIATGKPLGLIEPDPTTAGRFFYGLAKLGTPLPIRDVRCFWRSVRTRGLAGTLDRPIAGTLRSDSLADCVGAIRRLLEL
jgi:mitochondrial fission protein ELM1